MDDLGWTELHPKLRMSPRCSLDSTHEHQRLDKRRGWGIISVDWPIGLQLSDPHVSVTYRVLRWMQHDYPTLGHLRVRRTSRICPPPGCRECRILSTSCLCHDLSVRRLGNVNNTIEIYSMAPVVGTKIGWSPFIERRLHARDRVAYH
jgi:hypothetical protein